MGLVKSIGITLVTVAIAMGILNRIGFTRNLITPPVEKLWVK